MNDSIIAYPADKSCNELITRNSEVVRSKSGAEPSIRLRQQSIRQIDALIGSKRNKAEKRER
jgi:hypothetical protein